MGDFINARDDVQDEHRLPTPPTLIASLPASELAFFNKFTEILLFNQAPIAALEQIDIETAKYDSDL